MLGYDYAFLPNSADLIIMTEIDPNTQTLLSKVLVSEHDMNSIKHLKQFCDENNLVGMLDRSEDILDIVQGPIDLGAIFLGIAPNDDIEMTLAIARVIHHFQYDVPVFLRISEHFVIQKEWQEEFDLLFAGIYKLTELDHLKEMVYSHVFCMHYPPSLVRGFVEISENSLTATFKNSEIVRSHPSIVKDNTVYGEILSLIELESSWCRGYMMLQVDKPGILEAIKTGRTSLPHELANERGIDTMLSEITNLIWGGIKARFLATQKGGALGRIQVPIVINHTDKYVAFGSTKPQLCIEYKLRNKDDQASIITLYQRFIFNLEWTPELYKESDDIISDLVSAGELEMF